MGATTSGANLHFPHGSGARLVTRRPSQTEQRAWVTTRVILAVYEALSIDRSLVGAV
jgi:hypothetical protein